MGIGKNNDALQSMIRGANGEEINFWTPFNQLVEGYTDSIAKKMDLEDNALEILNNKDNNGFMNSLRRKKELKNLKKQILQLEAVIENYRSTLDLVPCFYKTGGNKEHYEYLNMKNDWNNVEISEKEKQLSINKTPEIENELKKLQAFKEAYERCIEKTKEHLASQISHDKYEQEEKEREAILDERFGRKL
jgi:hypothetical protein